MIGALSFIGMLLVMSGVERNPGPDIQKILIEAYQNDICSSLPLFPLLEDETEDTLSLYELPTMYVVNYHKYEKQQTDKSLDNLEKVKTCSDLFQVKDKVCKNIYLTGDAGVGKTSFCKFLSLLWCKSKLGKELEKVDMQEYIDFLARFDFVFYVNLRDTHFTDLIAIIVNQLFYCENKYCSNRMYDIVKTILGNHDSLVIMDGLDQWTPKPTDKRRYEIPVRPKSLKCVYLTTCRPYKIENVRLSEINLDHQVKMTGLGKEEIASYVCNLIKITNSKFVENKNNVEFMRAVEEVDLDDMLHIPMTTSHLVMLWFDRPLTSMSKSLIYGSIMDMLFKLAHKKGIDIQQSKPSKLKLPDRLSELHYFKDQFSQIEQLCFLSFKLLFEHDTDMTSLVFTRDQLASEPYCLSGGEINVFCTIGILSKNKVKGKFGKQEHKLSFLHKSYLEFFAAIYVSTFDKEKVLKLFSKCTLINDVLKYDNFLTFYAGLSEEKFVSLIKGIYLLISTNLELTRELSIFGTSYDTYSKKNQMISLQNLVLRCYKEMLWLCDVKNALLLEDFSFHYKLNEIKTSCLRKLIASNLNNVKHLWSDTGVFYDEFNKLNSLKVLHFSTSYTKLEEAFVELMKQNKSLQILSIYSWYVEIPKLPLEDLHYLTSLSLENLIISHKYLQCIVTFLSTNAQLKHLKLHCVHCTEHMDSDTCLSFDLVQCNKLVYLDLTATNIKCTNINTSSLECILLNLLFPDNYRSIINSIQGSLELKYLDINGCEKLDNPLVETLISSIQHLPQLKSIELRAIIIRDNVGLLLHPDVKQVMITLHWVKMTASWFQTFIRSVVVKDSCIQVGLNECIIKQDNGDTNRDMSDKESVVYMYDYIKPISAIKVVTYRPGCLEFIINDNH